MNVASVLIDVASYSAMISLIGMIVFTLVEVIREC